MREPVGVVAAITPWNFPLAMITRKAAPRWRPVARWCSSLPGVLPLSALALAVLAEKAGIPPGVFAWSPAMPSQWAARSPNPT